MHKAKNPLIFLFITVLIDCIGIRIVFPVSASIIEEVSGASINEAIVYSGWMMTAYAVMQFVFSPLLGSLSDRFGRRPVLLLSLLGLGIDYLFMSFADTLPLFFAGRVVAGICGASFATCFAYISDSSPADKRAQNFGLIGAAIGMGFIIGPFVGGLLSEFGIRVPFMAAACLSFFNLLYGFFILPESLKPENRRAFDIKRANPFGAFMQLRKNKEIRNLVVVMFLIYLSGQVMPSIWPFYIKYVYHWSDLDIGYSLAFLGVMVAIVKGGLIQWSQKTFGPVYSVYTGLLFCMAGLVLFAFADQSWMVYAITLVYCLGGIAPPSIQAIISGKMPANEQGELQGMMTSLVSLANIISPLVMTHLFYGFTKPNAPLHFAGMPFIAAAAIILVGLWLCHYEFRGRTMFDTRRPIL
ncbi:MAG: TCR/Tet family MFS transporter [Bacteroidetes bacterium]|nr:TCR/Tet family MFS transporter [Bacteroidota bacterium]